MKHIFTRMLGIETTFATKVEDFIKHRGPKITYTKQPLQNEFFVRSNDLLFQQGVNDFEIQMGSWEGVPCFFRTGERSNLPFDIFAASFYLLSRYEEYLPHIKDSHGRFSATESVAYKNDFLELPVVDLWASKLLKMLQEKFPELERKNKKYRYTSVVDVTTSHCFAYRGLIRGTAGFFLDLVTFKLRRVVQRILVNLKFRKDPYDNYFRLIDLHKKYEVQSFFFFQFAEYSTYDKNVSPNHNKFRHLIKSVADYSLVSLSASYSSFNDIELLKSEKKRLAEVLNKPINYSRMRYNRVVVPDTYRNLIAAEFTDDYTMGYSHHLGFRAGTSFPFNFYDLALEVKQPIKIHPFAVHDYALTGIKTEEAILAKLDTVYQRVKGVHGDFITIFSNELLGGEQRINWLELYHKVIQKYHV